MPSRTDQPHVEPVAYEGTPGHRLRLRGLALVVGEDEVATASVDVDGLAQLAQGEGGALDVPPGLPGPHRDSHDGSSDRDGCHSTKSRGLRLLGSPGLPPCSPAMASMVDRSKWLTAPNRSKVVTSK